MKTSSKKVQQVQVKQLSNFPTKSSYIRSLLADGMTRGDIVRHFLQVDGIIIRYQHVNNVMNQIVKKK